MRSTICLFAKPTRPGQVKRRLASELGDTAAAELATCFLLDSWALLQTIPWADVILATTDSAWGIEQVGAGLAWNQGSGDLGARIERIVRRALGRTATAFAIGADSPGLPDRMLHMAQAEIATHDAVLGPCADGGFYLLGLKQCPAGLLENLPWSSPDTFEKTMDRFDNLGMSTAVLPQWFDVDRPQDLWSLEARLDSGEILAAETHRWLRVCRALRGPRSPNGEGILASLKDR